MIERTLNAPALCPEGGGMAADQGLNNLHPEEVSAMDQSKSTVNWIEAYLKCPNPRGFAFEPGPLARSGSAEVNADASEQFAAAYLDWMDAEQQLCASDSDCNQFLRRILDVGDTSASALKLAVECLAHAERLLEDERRAWRRLSEMIDRTLGAPVFCPEGGGMAADQGLNNRTRPEISVVARMIGR